VTQPLALVTPPVGVTTERGLFYGVGFFKGALGREVVGLGGGWKLTLLKGGLLGKGGLGRSFLKGLDFFCYLALWARTQASSKEVYC